MEIELFETLLNKTESEELDFKLGQYKLDTDEEKAEFIKDVLAFANAWKTSDAYIICGVLEKEQRAYGIKGIDHHLEDNNLQQLVCSKTNRPPKFRYEPFTYKNKEFGIVIIDKNQDRPIHLIKDFGGLKANEVYIRHGSSTDIAKPDEIAKMGKASVSFEPPSLNIQLKNKETGDIIEKEASLKSTLLIFKEPLTKNENSKGVTTTTKDQKQTSEFNLVDKSLIETIGEISKTLKSINYDPDYPKKLKNYLWFKKIFTPIGFVIQNTGTSTAYDVKSEVQIKNLEKNLKDLLQAKVKLSYSLIKPPSKNNIDVSVLSELLPSKLNKDTDIDIISKGTEDEYLFEVNFGKIQPRYKVESKGFLYIGVTIANSPSASEEKITPNLELTFDMQTKTFADNLPNPIEKTFNFKIEINIEEYFLKDEDYEP